MRIFRISPIATDLLVHIYYNIKIQQIVYGLENLVDAAQMLYDSWLLPGFTMHTKMISGG